MPAPITSLPTPGRDTAHEAMETIARLADPERVQRLDALDRLWKGHFYDGRPSWWDVSVPLGERAPAVQSRIVMAAGGRLRDLVFGEGRFPNLTVSREAYGLDLADDARAALGRFVGELVRVARLRAGMLAAVEDGLRIGTVCAYLAVRAGRPSVELLDAKYCTPTFGPDGETVLSIDQRYRYDARDYKGYEQTYWFRRVIDAQADTVYLPALARSDGKEPAWTVDAARSTTHGLGFCPVKWHRHTGPRTPGDLDGTALFDGFERNVEALDMALSQHHRTGRYNGDPQMVVDDADGEAPRPTDGRMAGPPKSWLGRAVSVVGGYLGLGPAEKKGPDKIWHKPPGTKAVLVESTGAGASILREDSGQIRRAMLEAIEVVIASPETMSANASAALQRAVHEPMVNHAGRLREEYGPLLDSIVDMLARICLHVVLAGRGVRLVAMKAAEPVLRTLYAATKTPGAGPEDAPVAEWQGVPLEVTWGQYFEPTFADVKDAVGAAMAANGGKPVLSVRSSVKLVASLVGVQDVDAELAAIEEDEEDEDTAPEMPAPGSRPPMPPAQPQNGAEAPAEPDDGDEGTGRPSSPPSVPPGAPATT